MVLFLSKLISSVIFVYCLFFTQIAWSEVVSVPESTPSSIPASAGMVQQELRININQASAEELAAHLKGIGLKKAQRIVEYRQQYGLFTQLEQLQEVPGIGSTLYLRNVDIIKLE